MLEDNPSDEALVRAARAGDRQSFSRLVERHLPVLVAVCRRASDPSLAEDAAQEAVLQAMRSLNGLRDESRFGPWLVGIGLNTSRRLALRRQRATLLAGALLGGIRVDVTEDQPAEEAEQHELIATVQEAIAMLPEGQRRAVQAFYFQGLSYRESAAALGIETGSMRARLHKARKQLRHRLEPRFKEAGTMRKTGKEQVEVRVRDVRRREDGAENDYHVVILEEVAGDRRLPIWVGPFEGTAIAIHLLAMETPRPLTFTFMASLLRNSGANVREVWIQKLVGDTFYATVELRVGQNNTSVDARPSDAIALALVESVPIRVHAEVFAANEAREKAGPSEEEWHGAGTLGSEEIVADVASRWRPSGKTKRVADK